jgi:hypothetical protein
MDYGRPPIVGETTYHESSRLGRCHNLLYFGMVEIDVRLAASLRESQVLFTCYCAIILVITRGSAHSQKSSAQKFRQSLIVSWLSYAIIFDITG